MITTKYSILILLTLIYIVNCKDPKVMKKIDSKLKSEITILSEKNQINQRIVILFKVNENLTDLHYEILKREEVNINANIASIFTATIPANKVYNIAKLRWIEYVQGQKRQSTNPPDFKPSIRTKEK